MASMSSGRLRSWSVSSIRRTRVPPCWRAKSQLNSADRAPPTCRYPVGAGAKRTRGLDVTGSRVPAASPPLAVAGRYQGMATPPLGRRIWPVMNLLASEARYRTA